MQKIVIEKPGGYQQLKIQQAEGPSLSPGHVLIETKACGINFADCLVRMGLYKSAKEFVGWPITPGFEISGAIKAVGEGVTKWQVGQKVIAITLFGGYSSQVVVPEKQVFAKPEFLTFAQAAAIPAVFLTAYYALFELAHPRRKNTLLIHSAAGGVGSALIQLARLVECFTVGVVGASHKVAYVKSLGADVIIDKSSQNLWSEAEKYSPQGYDVILDANGAETLKESYRHLSSGGKLVVYGFHSMFSKNLGHPNWFKLIWNAIRTPRFNPLNMTSDNHSVLAFNLSYLFNKEEILQESMIQLLDWFNQKKILPPHVHTYPFEQIAQAQKDLESGQTTGKLVLTL